MTPNIEISTVVGCKMNCSYCPQKLHVTNYARENSEFKMSMDTFRKCIDKLPRHVEILFAGMAEPWLNPDATDMVLLAHSFGFKVGVYTTTVGMTKQDVDAIKHLPFLHFCIHLPDRDGKMKLNITTQYLYVLRQALQIPHNLVCIGDLHPAILPITGPVPDSTNGLISRAGNIKSMAIPPKTGPLECSVCGPKIDHNVLLPNGDVLLCCMDYGNENVIGNLLRDEYDDLFKSAEYTRIMDAMKNGGDVLCRKCELSK